jgi:3-oxoacyl-[acyl-carrier-protein] synthase II
MAPQERRVAVTGIGLVTPLGNDVQSNWSSLIAGRSGIRAISRFDASSFPVRIGGEVRGFDPLLYVEKKEVKKMDRFIQYAIAAAHEAVDDAGVRLSSGAAERTGVILGVGMGGIETIETYYKSFLETGLKRVTPFFIPRLIANMAPGQIAIRFGLRGVNYVTTSACASGGHAIGEAARLVRLGFQDRMLAGGAEAGVTPMTVGGFAVMRALSTRNDEPERASRPFDRERDGFVVAEGAAILVLEPLDDARRRGAHIYAEIAGYGCNADAYHITAPAPDGESAASCMRLALQDAGISPDEVDYINAHGTSTPANDINETRAIKRLFGEHARKLAVSSSKSMIGHALGAAGAIEAAYTALAIRDGILPPTINYENPDPECDLDYVPNEARHVGVAVALSNAFGFGGANATLALRRVD